MANRFSAELLATSCFYCSYDFKCKLSYWVSDSVLMWSALSPSWGGLNRNTKTNKNSTMYVTERKWLQAFPMAMQDKYVFLLVGKQNNWLWLSRKETAQWKMWIQSARGRQGQFHLGFPERFPPKENHYHHAFASLIYLKLYNNVVFLKK